MSLGWKDLVATLLALGVAVITYVKLQGITVPLLGSWRAATLVILVLGFATCIIAGSGTPPAQDGWTIIASILGSLALFIGIAGLLFNNQILFIALGATILTLWGVTTLHHIVTSP